MDRSLPIQRVPVQTNADWMRLMLLCVGEQERKTKTCLFFGTLDLVV